MRLFAFLVLLNYSHWMFSQENTYLQVDYIKTTNLDNALLQKKAPGFGEPISSLYRYEYFNGKSSYQFVADTGRNTLRSIVFYNIHKDLENNTIYLSLVKDPSAVNRDTLICTDWVLHTGVEKNVAGFTCHKASYEGFVAWYCESIPVPDGPAEKNCGLPGMILEVSSENIMIKAIRVEISDSGTVVEIPAVEKYLTTQEFRQRIMGY